MPRTRIAGEVIALRRAALAVGLHGHVLTRIARACGVPVLPGPGASGSGVPAAAASFLALRAAAEGEVAGLDGVPAVLAPFAAALARLKVERAAVRALHDALDAAGQHAEALALADAVGILDAADLDFSGRVPRLVLPRPIPGFQPFDAFSEGAHA